MTEEVFIDSGAFIALLDRSDRSHEDVRALFFLPPPRWSTSILVASETYGWFLHRLGEAVARSFRDLLVALPRLALLSADARHHALVSRALETHRGRKLTYVDASALVHMRERKIRTVWATDAHLGLEGAEVLPGPPRA